MANEKNKFYTERLNSYQTEIEQLLVREKNILALISKDEFGKEYKKMMLVEEMLYLTTLYFAKYQLSIALIGGKNEDILNDARKTVYKAIIYLEEIVTNFIDVPFSDYKDKVEKIEKIGQRQRYYLIRKMGLVIDMIIDAYGNNTKWKWPFVELEARYATVAKNILDLKDSSATGLDPHSPDYDSTVFHLRLVKQLLAQAADRYREKYEMATFSIEDFRIAIQYLLALRRIHLILNEHEAAEEVKKKAEIWSDKMEKDHQKREARRK
ncbi:hypothetical protein [Treponema phagedenis]|uniref:hypothetical protein n=1 Tax=Treponema phagedenis TaxID=162 RepID=UPI000465B934|nr:hypothetical protein [Treponema phagedenis]NVP23386.1 hypothetical protein [Treponema phagedenis]